MESLGKYLRTERELQNRSIEEAARTTRIRLQYLEAIEEDRYELLPPGHYLKGFLSAYAKYLGLDPDDVILRYQKNLKEVVVSKPEPTEYKPHLLPPKKRVAPWVFYVSALIVLLSIAFFSVFYLPHGPSEKEPHSPPPEKFTPIPSPVSSPSGMREDKKAPATQVKQVEMSEALSFEVVKAGIGTGIDFEDDHLVLKGKSIEFRCNDQKIYFFTRIKTPKEEKIFHVWSWEGREYHAKEISVKPPEYSVYSYLTLRSRQSGNWKAEVRVGEVVLASVNFKVIEAYSAE